MSEEITQVVYLARCPDKKHGGNTFLPGLHVLMHIKQSLNEMPVYTLPVLSLADRLMLSDKGHIVNPGPKMVDDAFTSFGDTVIRTQIEVLNDLVALEQGSWIDVEEPPFGRVPAGVEHAIRLFYAGELTNLIPVALHKTLLLARNKKLRGQDTPGLYVLLRDIRTREEHIPEYVIPMLDPDQMARVNDESHAPVVLTRELFVRDGHNILTLSVIAIDDIQPVKDYVWIAVDELYRNRCILAPGISDGICAYRSRMRE